MWVFGPAQSGPVRKAKKNAAGQAALDKLNCFLDAASQEPAYWLTRLWDDQQKAITYKELREAILSGSMSEKTLQAWQEDYAVFVNAHLKDSWTAAMKEAAAQREAMHPDFFFNSSSRSLRGWAKVRTAEWVTHASQEQKSAIDALIREGSRSCGVEELARSIRPLIGLNKPQAMANLRYYQTVRDGLLKGNPSMRRATAEQRAREASLKYAGKQHRKRAYTIATTELAHAHNRGADEAVKQAVEQGYMGKTVRVWSTAADEGVCQVCGGLDGVGVGFEEDFNPKNRRPFYGEQKRLPPAHPGCRCAVEYREAAPPAWKIGERGEDLRGVGGEDIIDVGMASGAEGETDGYTTITSVEDFDFTNPDAINLSLAKFAAKFKGAKEEHALILSPMGKAFRLTGTEVSVNTRLAGADAMKGAVTIHNHPVVDGYTDAFSREDFRELFWGGEAESWVIAGRSLYRMSYVGTPITPAEAVDLYKKAFLRVRQRAMERMEPIEFDQMETMRELANTLKGLSFDEFSI